MDKRFGILLTLGGMALMATSAQAQLVFGHSFYSSATPGLSGAYYLDITTGNATQMWTGASNKKVNGLAADEAHGVMYGNDAARVYRWDYGSLGTAPTQINGMYRMGSNGTVYATGVDGLAFAQNKLYAYTTYNAGGSANFVEDGIYEINTSITTAGVPNLTLKWSHPDLAYNFEGIDYNPLDGLFYGANTPNDTTQAGIYSIDVFGTGAVNKVANFDSFLADPDGLAIGGGHIWLTGKQSGDTDLKIVGYNLSTGSYDEAFTLGGFATTGRSTGATWAPNALNPVPEPATLAALGLGAVALLKRRKAAKAFGPTARPHVNSCGHAVGLFPFGARGRRLRQRPGASANFLPSAQFLSSPHIRSRWTFPFDSVKSILGCSRNLT